MVTRATQRRIWRIDRVTRQATARVERLEQVVRVRRDAATLRLVNSGAPHHPAPAR